MFPAHHGASSFGLYRHHRSSGAQTKDADLINGLMVMPSALGLVEFFEGGQVESARGCCISIGVLVIMVMF
jgi:hypothetical protein